MSWRVCSFDEAPAGLGSAPMLHRGRWYVGQSGSGWFRALKWGLGATLPNPKLRPEVDAAMDLLDYLRGNGCTQASFPACATFQATYNASGLPGRLSVDGQYGGNTMRALQNVMDEAQADAGTGPSQQAPADCFQGNPTYGPEAVIPGLDVVTPTPAPTTTVVVNPPAPSSPNWLIWGALAAGATAIGYTYWKKHHRGRRP